MSKLNAWVLILAAVFSLGSLFAEEAAAPDPEAAAEEKPEKKKKPPRKQPEYRSFETASAVAQAHEQPIVAFVDLQGEPKSSQVRMKTVGTQEFIKEIMPKNCVYYHLTIPAVKVKQNNNRRGNNQAMRKEPPKPDMEAVKPTEKAALAKIAAGAKGGGGAASLPKLAVVDPNGRLLGMISVSPEDATLKQFVGDLKSAFEAGKYEFTVTKRLEKALKAEQKKLDALEKRKK